MRNNPSRESTRTRTDHLRSLPRVFRVFVLRAWAANHKHAVFSNGQLGVRNFAVRPQHSAHDGEAKHVLQPLCSSSGIFVEYVWTTLVNPGRTIGVTFDFFAGAASEPASFPAAVVAAGFRGDSDADTVSLADDVALGERPVLVVGGGTGRK